jgi:hypothetical protein
MNTDQPDLTALTTGRIDRHEPTQKLRQWWSVITALLAVAIFLQAIFAGAMLSGADLARAAHISTAIMLTISAVAASLVCFATLRRIPNGQRLGFTLALLAATVFLQTATGKLSAGGANLLWVHVPLGVALVGLAARAFACARKLGG